MKGIDLEMLGLTKQELQERVTNCIADRMLNEVYTDSPDGEEILTTTSLGREFQKVVKQLMQDTVSELGNKYVLPDVKKYIEEQCLQRTNTWGEAKGEKLTFVEYLVEQARNYMVEDVDINGKSRSENRSHSFTKSSSRLTYMIDKHLKYSIENAMKTILKDANGVLVDGIQETVKMKLNEVADKLKFSVSTGR